MTEPAFDFDQLFKTLAETPDERLVPDELKNIVITIEGNLASGCIDYSIAQAMVQLQQIIYRIASHALYGESATVKNLNEHDQEKFKLAFKVSPGCTEISTRLAEVFLNLFRVIFKDMTPVHKVCLVAFCGGVFLGYIALDRAGEYLLEKERYQVFATLSEEETKRLNLVLEDIAVGGQEASNNFAKSARGADSLSFGARSYSKEDLSALQKRLPRSSIDWETDDSAYVVTTMDMQKGDVLWVVLKDIATGEIFRACYDFGGEDASDDDLPYIMAQSLLKGTAIGLKVNKGRKKGDPKILKAWVLDLADQAKE